MYIKREIEQKIIKYMKKKEIIAVVGARQCGKTTMITNLLKKYQNVNSITLENVEVKQLFENDINSFIDLHVAGYDFLFIDEVQYAKNGGKHLKYIYDTQKIKIIISGSSSTDLSINSLKYLVGRIFIFQLHPFSFSEFLLFKDEKLFGIYKQGAFKETINTKIQKYIHEYMQYGGYPRVVLSDSNEEKKFVLENIYDTYLLREIKEIMQLSKNDQLIKLLKALALQIGNMLQYNELSQISGFNFNTLKKYMYILEQTFICKRCSTFYTNKRLEIVKVPKIYFLDHGFRNQCAGDFSINEQQIGAFYENLVYSEYLKKGIELKYWRTTSQAEVDFIKDERIPVEIKKRPKVTRAFQSFIKKYQPEEGFVISEVEKESIVKNGCKIHFLPFGKFI